MKIWHDKSLPLGQAQFWLMILSIPVWLGVFGVSTYAVVDCINQILMGEPKYFTVLLFITSCLFSGLMVIVLFGSYIHAFSLVKKIEICEKEIFVECYFNRKTVIKISDITSLGEVPKSWLYERMTFMPAGADNFFIQANSGRRFYLSAMIDGVELLLVELKSLIKQFRVSTQQ